MNELKKWLETTILPENLQIIVKKPEKIMLDIDNFDDDKHDHLVIKESEIRKLKYRNSELLDQLDKYSSPKNVCKIEESPKNIESDELFNIRFELNQKEIQLANLGPFDDPIILNREILKLKTKITYLNTKKSLETTAHLSTRVQRSMARIEKEWLINEEKTKIRPKAKPSSVKIPE